LRLFRELVRGLTRMRGRPRSARRIRTGLRHVSLRGACAPTTVSAMSTAAIETAGLTKFYGETRGIEDLDYGLSLRVTFG